MLRKYELGMLPLSRTFLQPPSVWENMVKKKKLSIRATIINVSRRDLYILATANGTKHAGSLDQVITSDAGIGFQASFS